MRVNVESFSLPASSAIAPYLRVTTSAGKLVAAGDNEFGLGTLAQRVLAANDPGAVIPWNVQGTRLMVAAGAIPAHSWVYAAAGGKVSATPNGFRIGRAMESASGDGSHIQILTEPNFGAGAPKAIEHHTENDTLTIAESGSIHTNLGASGAITLNLPQDAPAGTQFTFIVMTAQAMNIDPGAGGGIYINGGKQTDDKYISADDEAETVVLTADGNGDWIAGPYNGTWTVEA